MMKLPIQYRVSGLIGPKARGVLLKCKPWLANYRGASGPPYIMRADYVVVSPNRPAYTYVGLRIHWKGGHAQP